jgi:hypothetical protein
MKTIKAINDGENLVSFVDGKITIYGSFYTNYGIAYETGKQRIGMDNSYGLTKRVVIWLTKCVDDWRL